MNIFLDIETIPGQEQGLREEIAATITPPGNMKKAETIAKWEAEEKPAAIEEAWRKTAFDGSRGEIVCIAWAVDSAPVRSVFYDPINDPGTMPAAGENRTEADLLQAFFIAVATASENQHGRLPRFIGHNVRDFDLRFLFHRAVILGVRPPFHLPHDARPGSDFVFDTMEAWAGYRNRISLDRLCRAFGIPTKGAELGGEEIDGSKVWDFVQAGRIEEVATYCRADVERVRAVHQRITFAEPATVALAV